MMLEARHSPWRVLLMLLGAALFVLLGLWIAGVFGPFDARHDAMAPLIGWAGVLCFGLCAVLFVRRLLDRQVALRVDGTGIFWRSWSSATIPWSAIASIELFKIQRQHMIGVRLHDPRQFPASGLMGKLAAANALIGATADIYITAAGLDHSHDEIVRAIETCRPPTRNAQR